MEALINDPLADQIFDRGKIEQLQDREGRWGEKCRKLAVFEEVFEGFSKNFQKSKKRWDSIAQIMDWLYTSNAQKTCI